MRSISANQSHYHLRLERLPKVGTQIPSTKWLRHERASFRMFGANASTQSQCIIGPISGEATYRLMRTGSFFPGRSNLWMLS